MGTGKTKVVVDLITNQEYKKTLILCPKTVLTEEIWTKEFIKNAINELNLHLVVPIKGSVAKKTDLLQCVMKGFPYDKKQLVVILNYESASFEPFRSFSLQHEWDLVVLDESHRIKAPGGKWSWYAKALSKRSKKRICLTGTPMPHSPLDIYAQYRFLNNTIFGKSFALFRLRYAIMGGFNNKQVLGFHNKNDLKEKFRKIAFSVKKDALDLPEEVDIDRVCNLSPSARKIYDDLHDNFIALVNDGIVTASNALSKLLRLQQVSCGFVGGIGGENSEIQEVGDSKISLCEDILKDIDPKDPIVIFYRFKMDAIFIRRMANRNRYTISELSGRVNELPAWQKGETKILAVQIQAGGVGIDLTRSSFAIYYSIGFSLGDYLQSRSRVHRPGQEKKATFIHIICRDTIDKNIYAAFKKNANVIQSIIEDVKGGEVHGRRKAQAIC